MKAYKFTVAQHAELGTLGFKPQWYPAGEPLGGMAAAHDILEHFPKDDGSPEGEYMALGASLYIRGDSNCVQNKHFTLEESIAADLTTVWGVLVNRENRTFVKPCSPAKDPDLMERARTVVRYWLRDERESGSDIQPDVVSQERVACWIAKGYVRARKRYRGVCSDMLAYDLFKPIEEEADRLLKYAEEGMILTVRVDFANRHATVNCDFS